MDSGAVEFSEIQYFYKNSTVLVTGATGFVGKLVLERILRRCYVKHVYVLVRSKHGKEAEERCAEIFDSEAFNPLRRIDPEFFNKVSLIQGDLEKPDLGLNDFNKNLIIKEVNCIFHCGAATSFDENLKTATLVNVRATRDIFNLAKQAENLKTFVFLSSIFSNFPKYEIHDEIYASTAPSDKLIGTVENLDDEILKSIEPQLLSEWPTAYTFTKQVAENLLKVEGKDYPVSIVRPSHITPAELEPTAGYVENIYSLAGLAAANALGVNRVNYYKNATLDVIPVDYVVGLLIASGWYAGLQKIRKKRGDIASTDVLVYNCVTSQEKPMTTDEWVGLTETAVRDTPTTKMIRLPLAFQTACYYNYKLLTFFFHTLMGYLCDTGLAMANRPPVILEGYRNFHKFQQLGSKFLMKQWYFSNENAQKLLKRMSFRDRELFNFDVLNINWETYFPALARGIRVYILKDPMSTITEGRLKQSQKLNIQLISSAILVVILYVIFKVVLSVVFFR